MWLYMQLLLDIVAQANGLLQVRGSHSIFPSSHVFLYMQAVAEPPPAAQQQPLPQNTSGQSSERSTGSHASDHQHSGSGSRMSSEPDSSPGSRGPHGANGGDPAEQGLLNLTAAAEHGGWKDVTEDSCGPCNAENCPRGLGFRLQRWKLKHCHLRSKCGRSQQAHAWCQARTYM